MTAERGGEMVVPTGDIIFSLVSIQDVGGLLSQNNVVTFIAMDYV